MKAALGAGGREGAGTPKRGIPIIAEVFGYVGGAFALAAVVALVAAFWAELGTWGRVGLAAAAAFAGLAGGFAIERIDSPAAERLSQFLLMAGVVGSGAAVGFLVNGTARGDLVREWAWFAAFAAAAVAGGLVWWGRRTWMQHLAFGIGVGVASLLALPLIPVEGPEWGAGAVLVLVGVVWAAMTLKGWLDPENAGLALACLGILGGFEIMALAGPGGMMSTAPWALWTGLVAAVALTVTGVLTRRIVMLGCGAAGVVLFAAEVVSRVFESEIGAAVALIGLGLAILGGALYMTRRSREGAPAIPVPAEIAGYVGTAFVLAGGVLLASGFWEDIGVAGRIAVPAIASAAAYAAGVSLGKIEDSAARRLSQVLLGTGVVAAAFTAAMGANPIVERVGEASAWETGYATQVTFLCGASAGTVIAGITWWLRKSVITLLAFGGALFMAVQAAFSLMSLDSIAFWMPGATMLAIGLAWVVLAAMKRLEPVNAALAYGSFVALSGLMGMQMDGEGEPVAWAAFLGIAISVAAILASIPLKRGVLLGFGAAGVLVLSIQTIMTFFEGEIAGPILLLVAGVVFIGVAVVLAVLLPKMRDPSHGTGAHAV